MTRSSTAVFGAILTDREDNIVDMVMHVEGFAIASPNQIPGFLAETLSRSQQLLSRDVHVPTRIQFHLTGENTYTLKIIPASGHVEVHENVVIVDSKLQVNEDFIPLQEYLHMNVFVVKPREKNTP